MMTKHLLIAFFLILITNFSQAQSAGTYDGTFSGDGKVTYTNGDASSAKVFLYNNEYITFSSKSHTMNGSDDIVDLLMIKHDMAGNFISVKTILSDSASVLHNRYDHDVTMIKQTSNGKFVVSTVDQLMADNTDGYWPYNSSLYVFNANGTLDASFGTNGKKVMITDTLFGENERPRSLEIGLYTDNSIFAAHSLVNASSYTKVKCYKINTTGSITNNFTVGTGNYNYYIKEVLINSDNTLYLGGVTDYNTTYNCHFIHKLTASFNYDNTFDSDGKLFIKKGNASPFAWGAGILHYNIDFTSNGTDLFTYFLVADSTLAPGDQDAAKVFVHQYTPSGTFVAEKEISTPAVDLYSIAGIALDNNGKVVVLTSQYDTTNGYAKTYIVRLNANTLTYDNTFDGDGKKILSFSGYTSNYGESFLIQADNKIVIGISAVGTVNGNAVALARINGDAVVTNIAGVTTHEIALYPNPANDILKIATTDPTQFPLSIDLYNTNGQLVKNVWMENASDIVSLIDLANGFYVVKVINAKGLNSATKLLIQH